MALKFKTSGASDDALAQLLQLAQFSQQRKATKQKSFMDVYKEFNVDVDSLYNNEELEYQRKRAQNYLADNRDNMDEITLERFQNLEEQYTHQKVLNSDYDMKMKHAYDIGGRMTKFGEEYVGADSMVEFEGLSIPKAEDYDLQTDEGKALYNTAYDEYEANIYKKRDEYKRNKSEEMKKLVGEYSQHQDEFRQAHGDRFNTEAFKYDSLELAQLQNVFMFAVDSVGNDGMFDMEERDAYKYAIQAKSYQPIANFIIKDNEMKQGMRQTLVQSMDLFVESGEQIQNQLDKFTKTIRVGEDINSEEWIAIENQEAFKMPTGVKDEYDSINYKTLKEAMDNQAADPNNPILVYKRELQAEQSNILNQLKVKEASIIKNYGASYLSGAQSANDSFNNMLQSAKKEEVITTGVAPPERVGVAKPVTTKTPTPYAVLDSNTITKDMKKNKQYASKFVNQINTVSDEISTMEADLKELKIEHDTDLQEIKDKEESLDLIKSGKAGVGYFDEDRRKLVREIRALKNEYHSKWESSQVSTSKKSLVDEYGFSKDSYKYSYGMSLKKYINSIPDKLPKLREEYNIKLQHLNKTVEKNS